jgi:hypothetical protein
MRTRGREGWRLEFEALGAGWDRAGLPRETSAAEVAALAAALEGLALAGVPGGVLECGAYAGYSSCCLSRVCADLARPLWVADSFAGLPASGDPSYRAGQFACPRADFEANLGRWGNPGWVGVVEGWFRDGLAGWPEPLALVWLDVDLRDSVRDVLLGGVLGRLHPRGLLFSHEAEPGYFTRAGGVSDAANGVWSELAAWLDASGRAWRAEFVTGCLGKVEFTP